MEQILDWGIDVIRAIQTVECAPLTLLAMFIHHVFSAGIYVAVLLVILWCVDEKKGYKLGATLLFSVSVNSIIKDAVKEPRPYTRDPTIGRATETSWSFPSGHSQTASTFWTVFASFFKKNQNVAKLLIAILLPVIVALSRNYLGVHYPTDVLCGLIIGYIISIGVLLFWTPCAKILKPLRWSVKILIIALICFVLNALNPTDTGYSAGLFGFVVGYILCLEKGEFSAQSGTFLQKFLRLLIGGAILGAVYLGAKTVFPGKESDTYQLFRFIRYALVGFCGTYVCPKIFVLAKIAVPVSKSEEIAE